MATGPTEFLGRFAVSDSRLMRCPLWQPIVALLLLTPSVLAAAPEPNPVQPRKMRCRFGAQGERASRVADYGSAIELEQPGGTTMTYHFAVDTAPPLGGTAVDNQGVSWEIVKQPSPYQLNFRNVSSNQTIECRS